VAARGSAPVIGALCSGGEIHESDADGGGPFSAHRWAINVGYRYQYSHRHFVGTDEQTVRKKNGSEVTNALNLFDVALTYRFSPRWSMTVSLPIVSVARTYDHQLFNVFLHIPNAPDQITHTNAIGDMAVSAQLWLIRPPAENGHNIAFSFGAKLPTGNCAYRDTVNTIQGPQEVYVDQSIQPGDCGWGILTGTQMYQRVKRSVLYLSGSYLIQPQEQNHTPNKSLWRPGTPAPPNPLTQYMSIPDQYLVDGGIANPFPKVRRLVIKTGMRYEGVKVRDLLGGSLGFRRPGYSINFEPGLQYERGKDTWSINSPIAIWRNRKRSVPDLIQGKAGDAAFADWLLTVGYSHSF